MNSDVNNKRDKLWVFEEKNEVKCWKIDEEG